MRVEILKLHKKMNSNIIYVTHDQVEAMTLADKNIFLKRIVILKSMEILNSLMDLDGTLK